MSRPSVDIIIPFHGQFELVTRCVSSIFACTPNQDYKIYLVDDHSSNDEYIKFMGHANKRIINIRTDERKGFGGALQEGFDAGKNNYVVFMHSDVYVDNINWLINLQRCYGSMKDQAKLFSARSNSAGTSNSYNENLIGNKEDVIESCVSASALPLFCSFCHRDLFTRIGGFVKSYPFAWYEDEELFWRMKYYGFNQGICGNSYVVHDGGATISKVDARTMAIMESNRDQCLKDIKPFLPKTPQLIP